MTQSDRDAATRARHDQSERQAWSREVWAAPHLHQIDLSRTGAADGANDEIAGSFS